MGVCGSLTQASNRIWNFVITVCTLSITSINAFAEVCSSFLSKGYDPRHEILLKVDGVDLPILYNTRAPATCLTRKPSNGTSPTPNKKTLPWESGAPETTALDSMRCTSSDSETFYGTTSKTSLWLLIHCTSSPGCRSSTTMAICLQKLSKHFTHSRTLWFLNPLLPSP